MNNVHINFARKDKENVSILKCHNCHKRCRFYGWFQEWYGWHITCTGCGEQWADGEWLERPFRPRWRRDNIEQAKKSIKEYYDAINHHNRFKK